MSVNLLLNPNNLNLKGGSLGLASLSSTDIAALTPTNGEIVYNSTTGALNMYTGSDWIALQTTSNPSGDQPYCHFLATIDTSNFLVDTLGGAYVICENVIDNVSSNGSTPYNGTTGQFTAPFDGIYQFNFNSCIGATTVTNIINPFIRLETSSLSIIAPPSAFGGGTYNLVSDPPLPVTLSACLKLSQGDIVSLFTQPTGGDALSPTNAYYVSQYSTFSGCLVSAF